MNREREWTKMESESCRQKFPRNSCNINSGDYFEDENLIKEIVDKDELNVSRWSSTFYLDQRTPTITKSNFSSYTIHWLKNLLTENLNRQL